MSTKDVIKTVNDLVQPILDQYGFYLFDTEFVKEGHSWYLRVYIDKTGGITLEDCVNVSDQLSDALDNCEPDPIPQAYFLEVSSPGAERPLKREADYQRAIGDYIHLSLYQAIDGKKTYEGYLKTVTADELTIDYLDKTRHKTLTVPRKLVAKARLAVKI
ncbi:ribosome maturation factor RimP [uncultured Limosilactobacillus sp.]|uniref:ribosome maturation factor RimP n=1 Tax=uncultured Limosilactobacillus sp. TaxID=2837629 RepID=UPI0025FFB280|nr:ribosome maturation factor RimP [uncultured Limosilactobacillus sp.]